MKFQDLYEKENKEHSAVSSGVQTLPVNQYMGAYKFSKDVAGHDGKKQHSPDASGSKAYTDKPIVVGYTDVEDQMTKAVLPKTKQTVGAGSEEPSTVQKNSPLSKKSVKEAYQNDEANVFYKYDTADGKLKQRMVQNLDEPRARSAGYKETQEQALKAAGIMRSKFDPKKFVQNQNGKWVTVYPYGQQGVTEAESELMKGAMNEFAPGPGDDDDDKYTPANFGKPFKANYLGQNKFEVFCRKPQDPSNVIKLNAEVQKYGLEWEENFGFWFLDSPGAVYLSWKYGEIPLPKAIDQASNPGHIHDLVTDYLTHSPHAAEIQKIATEYFGFTVDGEMSESVMEQELDEACWKGYHKEGNKKMFGKTYPNCVKNKKTNEEYTLEEIFGHKCPHCNGELVSEELISEKQDACYHKVKGRYKVWPSAYASGALVQCRKKGAANWGNKSESITQEEYDQLDENLKKWFSDKWVRFGPDGKIKGDCARGSSSEGKPKCLPQSKAYSLGKKGRASAGARKRRQDPDADRSGKAINVATKKKSNEGITADIRDYFTNPGNDTSSPFRKKAMPPEDIQLIMLNMKQRQPVSKADQYRLADWLRRNQGTRTVYADVNESDMGEGVIYQLDKENPMSGTEVLVIGGAGRYSLDGLRAKARKEVAELAKDLEIEHGGAFRRSAQNIKQLQNTLNTIVAAYDELNQIRKLGGIRSKGIKDEDATVVREGLEVMEKWTQKYKNSINCSDPKGFSQQAHCAGKKK